MKKYLLIIIALCLTVSLAGCGDKKEEANNGGETKQPETNDNTDNEEEVVEDIPAMIEDYELYSDDTKLVFKDGSTYKIYYYSGKKVTGYQTYTDYGTSEDANSALLNLQKDKTMKDVYVKGQYLVIEYAESQYKNLNPTELRSKYSDIEQVQDKW